MAKIFVNNVGRIGVIREGGLPGIVKIDGWSASACLITRLGVAQRSNIQIQPALRNGIYVYAFGDGMGELQVGGVCFIGDICNGAQGAADGVQQALQFYARNRVAKTLTHVNVTIGRTPFSGFLVGVQLGTESAENRIFTWQLSFASLPNFEGLASGLSDEGPGAALTTTGASSSSSGFSLTSTGSGTGGRGRNNNGNTLAFLRG
jgi:hypothetical protein